MDLKNELEHYKRLSSNLLEAADRMELFRQSLEVLNLCRSSAGVVQSVVDMIQRVLPIQSVAFYKMENKKWGTADKILFPLSDSDLDWALSHDGPSLFPMDDTAMEETPRDSQQRPVRSYLLFPLKSEKSVTGCLAGWTTFEAGDVPQHLLRMLSALHAEAVLALDRVKLFAG